MVRLEKRILQDLLAVKAKHMNPVLLAVPRINTVQPIDDNIVILQQIVYLYP